MFSLTFSSRLENCLSLRNPFSSFVFRDVSKSFRSDSFRRLDAWKCETWGTLGCVSPHMTQIRISVPFWHSNDVIGSFSAFSLLRIAIEKPFSSRSRGNSHQHTRERFWFQFLSDETKRKKYNFMNDFLPRPWRHQNFSIEIFCRFG